MPLSKIYFTIATPMKNILGFGDEEGDPCQDSAGQKAYETGSTAENLSQEQIFFKEGKSKLTK